MNTLVSREDNATILVVDDNITNLRLLTAILSQHGYTVKIAKSALAGLRHLKQCQTDLILLDIKMPHIDGYQFCIWLKSHPTTKNIPIIFLSGTQQSIAKIKAFSVGGADFIAKPFQSIDVLARIEHQLQLAYLQRQLRDKNKILAAEVKRRQKIEALLLSQKAQLKKEIKQRQHMEELLRLRNIRLTRQANIDDLTQVANRRHFDHCLVREISRAHTSGCPLSLVLCDIDFFKKYNDYYGHQGGDKCLNIVAQTLADVVNLPGDLVARYGGEEFALILPDTYMDAAIEVVHCVQRTIAELKLEHQASEISNYITISFGGCTLLPGDCSDAQSLIKNADQALYDAKRRGRSQVRWCHENRH
ncbi:diguanylate cyclase domain-containing protein [[Limnothrix rosea] IAM M-220]|uniref:GGDEF domain-containing response regulator n=1 Tax=[Limnothrix rosea] IAM M-220 TaxID=454133 RepID=UPI000968D288|nr:diguanylate cyclase [[Limnothrix rosea] IAM M-220]OKH18002.1 hypothetical protein NIES208_07480 [[Limnothrix rosea] IAM M-220]